MPGAAQCYHGHIGVAVTQTPDHLPLWQTADPVKKLPRPAAANSVAAMTEPVLLPCMATISATGGMMPKSLVPCTYIACTEA